VAQPVSKKGNNKTKANRFMINTPVQYPIKAAEMEANLNLKTISQHRSAR
jgi:hypothetical protein